MASSAVSAGGIASVLLAASTRLWNNVPPPVVPVTRDGSFLRSDWVAAGDVPPCEWYNGSYQYSNALCSHFAMARMSAAIQSEAVSRALSCGAFHETDCVLSPEVGLSVPAAFVYDQAAGLNMVIAPKITALHAGHNSSVRTVAFQDPAGERRHAELEFNDTITVEFLEGGTRSLATETFTGSSAYCIQMLRLAIEPACWAEID